MSGESTAMTDRDSNKVNNQSTDYFQANSQAQNMPGGQNQQVPEVNHEQGLLRQNSDVEAEAKTLNDSTNAALQPVQQRAADNNSEPIKQYETGNESLLNEQADT